MSTDRYKPSPAPPWKKCLRCGIESPDLTQQTNILRDERGDEYPAEGPFCPDYQRCLKVKALPSPALYWYPAPITTTEPQPPLTRSGEVPSPRCKQWVMSSMDGSWERCLFDKHDDEKHEYANLVCLDDIFSGRPGATTAPSKVTSEDGKVADVEDVDPGSVSGPDGSCPL